MGILSILGLEKKETVLLIDIGNGSITTALVSFSKNNLPKFLYSSTKSFVVSEKPEALRLSLEAGSLLETLLSETVKKSKNLSCVLVSFSSPWFVPKVKNVFLLQKAPFIITKAFLNDVTLKEKDVFKKELILEFSLNNPDSFSIIEANIVHTKINGYIVANPIGKKTKSLEATIFMSSIAKNVEKKVLGVVSKYTHIGRDKILLHSFPLVSFSVVSENLALDQDFILMDITSEAVDMTLVNNDAIIKTISFPFGKNSIIRQISKSLKLSFPVAESQLHMSTSNKINDTSLDSIRATLVNLEKEWSIYFEDALTSFSTNIVLPKQIYITVEDDIEPVFIDFLKMEKTDKTKDFRKNISITSIKRETLAHLYRTDSKVKENQFIVILALFFDKIFKS